MNAVAVDVAVNALRKHQAIKEPYLMYAVAVDVLMNAVAVNVLMNAPGCKSRN
jgi:hypothetical protein